MFASTPDLLRLLAVPVFGWAAWRDVETRRVPNRTWYPLAALAVALLAWEGAAAVADGDRLFLVQVAVSVGFVVPVTTAFWYTGSFGGADAKAFYVIALLFPAYPVFYLPWAALPAEPTPIGVFSLTVLSNTVVVGVAYPMAVALGNLLRGRLAWPMLVGKPVPWDRVTDEYGVLLETPSGYTRAGLDLDALRMYLQWRGASLADLRAAPATHRDPASLPAAPNAPGDGGLAADGGAPVAETNDERPAARNGTDGADAPGRPAADPWGAEAFLADVEGSAYGTTPAKLRDGLDVLVDAEEVWVSPGIPFLVPLFVGLLVSLTYGDVLFVALATLGLA